jgi:hypothetical protein
MADKLAQYRAHALAAETKAFNARTDESRRAWLIVARDWKAMADQLKARMNGPKREFDAEELIGRAIVPRKPAE